jgi:hypothetical protein
MTIINRSLFVVFASFKVPINNIDIELIVPLLRRASKLKNNAIYIDA